MNSLTLRRKWLVARPWLKDGAMLLAFLAMGPAALWALGETVDFLTRHGWLS